MPHNTQNRKEIVQAKKRIFALVCLACLVAVSLLSEAFILTHTHHEHDHQGVDGGCTVCAQIQSAENLLKRFAATVGRAMSVFTIFGLILILSCPIFSLRPFQTLVSLKIQMNN